jgi:protein-tyrosine phosphatase
MKRPRLLAAAGALVLVWGAVWLANAPPTLPPPDLAWREPASTEPRILALEGGRNFRDLGGYTTATGRRTRWGLVYRSGSLAHLTASDLARLAPLGVTDIFDLRKASERTQSPTRWPGPAIHPVPMSQASVPAMARALAPVVVGRATPDSVRASIARIYGDMALDNAPLLGAIYRRIASAHGASVVHCMAGRDRTGIAVAILLRLLDVPPETIVQDYLLSNRDPRVRRLPAFAPGNPLMEPNRRADRLYIAEVLRRIEAGCGTFDHYRRQRLGLTNVDLAALRARLTE